MAQILKFQQGGTLIIDDIKYAINDDLVSQYRFLGREFDDDHEKKYYNQFMSKLKQGLNDKSVEIVIDTNAQSIEGIDLSGYTERQQRAIGTNQTDAGKLITHLFRPTVTGAKSAAETLGNFLPRGSKETFKKHSITTPINLEHEYNKETGEFEKNNEGGNALKKGQDDKINEIKERINFAKHIGNIPVHDLILGYNEESREDIENLIKEIDNLEAFQNRLINGTYTNQDEVWAKTFGIFMDDTSSEERSKLKQTHEYETSYQKAGLPTS